MRFLILVTLVCLGCQQQSDHSEKFGKISLWFIQHKAHPILVGPLKISTIALIDEFDKKYELNFADIQWRLEESNVRRQVGEFGDIPVGRYKAIEIRLSDNVFASLDVKNDISQQITLFDAMNQLLSADENQDVDQGSQLVRLYFPEPILINEQSKEAIISFDANTAFQMVAEMRDTLFGIYRPAFRLIEKNTINDRMKKQAVELLTLPVGQGEGILYDEKKHSINILPDQIGKVLLFEEAENLSEQDSSVEMLDLSSATCHLLILRQWNYSKSFTLNTADCRKYLTGFVSIEFGHINRVMVTGDRDGNNLLVNDAHIVLYVSSALDTLSISDISNEVINPQWILPNKGLSIPLAQQSSATAFVKDFIASLNLKEDEPIAISMRFAYETTPSEILQGPESNDNKDIKMIYSDDEGKQFRTKAGYREFATKVGKEVASFLMYDVTAESFNDHSRLMTNLEAHLKEKKVLVAEDSLFDVLIKSQTNIDSVIQDRPKSQLARNFDEDNSVKLNQRNHLAAIVALQWYQETLKDQDAQYKRGSTIITDFENLNKFYLKYINEVNKTHGMTKDIDFTVSSSSIYRDLSKIRSATHPKSSTKAYSRDGLSSHLKQKDLIDPHQFGVDMRLSSDSNSVSMLPTDAQHLLLGFYEADADVTNTKVQTFYKMEGHGLSKAADFILHMQKWVEHSKSGKAGAGFRETRLDVEATKVLIQETNRKLEEKGVKLSDEFSRQFLSMGAKNLTVGYFIRVLNEELKQHNLTDNGFIEEIFGKDAEVRIGSEVRLTPESYLQNQEGDRSSNLKKFRQVNSIQKISNLTQSMDDISLSIGKKNIGERDLRRVESDSSLLKFQNEEMDSTMESYRAIKKSKR
jgi:hypothetical protein